MPSLLAVFIATATLTAYQPVAKQTDDSPTWTSEGDRTTKHGVAVSQDMLRDGRVHYGDIILIEGYGMRVVNDCMNKRHKNRIDILVFTHREEQRIGTRPNVKVWRIDYGTEGKASNQPRNK
jgi:3D (Asp-Asp-Asp) domain-containing protein